MTEHYFIQENEILRKKLEEVTKLLNAALESVCSSDCLACPYKKYCDDYE